MIKAYLFDWGNTLMRELPGMTGKMCDWPQVKAVDGASEVLKFLSKKSDIVIATGANDSTEKDIAKAFARANLDSYISDYFCRANIGHAKGSREFLEEILNRLQIKAEEAVMVGDSLEKDIKPALAVGLHCYWLGGDTAAYSAINLKVISRLTDLLAE
jgi:putative hydrolase of the HAD superfamily